jgi:hypothetical protein
LKEILFNKNILSNTKSNYLAAHIFSRTYQLIK